MTLVNILNVDRGHARRKDDHEEEEGRRRDGKEEKERYVFYAMRNPTQEGWEGQLPENEQAFEHAKCAEGTVADRPGFSEASHPVATRCAGWPLWDLAGLRGQRTVPFPPLRESCPRTTGSGEHGI